MAGEFGQAFRKLLRFCIREELARVSAAERKPPRVNTPKPKVIEQPEWFSRQDVARMTGYSVSTINRLIRKGLLKTCGLHGGRIARFEVDRLMAASKHELPDDRVSRELARMLGEEV